MNQQVSSARVPPPGAEDPRKRVTKKVKTREGVVDGVEVIMEEVVSDSRSTSFREALLTVPGLTGLDDEEFVDWEDDDDMPENRWYKENEDPKPPEFFLEGNIPVINVSDRELMDWSEPWKLTLVVNIMGKKVNFRVLENKLNRDWAREGSIKIIDLPKGFFAVMFSAETDYNRALFEGPWMVADHYLLVQRWRPNFINRAKKESKIAVWIRIPELALELYNLKFLTRLGSSLGNFLKMDQLTTFHHRGQFARICVELDLNKALTPHVIVRGEKARLEYEGLHAVCFTCGIYGHRMDTCTVQKPTVQVPTNSDDGVKEAAGGEREKETESSLIVGGDGPAWPISGETATVTKGMGSIDEGQAQESKFEDGSGSSNLGPWMLSKKATRKRNMGSLPSKVSKSTGVRVKMGQVKEVGSRFDVLKDTSVETHSSSGKELAVFAEKDKGSGPALSPLVEEVRGPSILGPITHFKVRNQSGGKNTQVGPTVRDLKKAARSISPYQKPPSLSEGGGGPKIKESFVLPSSSTSKGVLPKGEVSEYTRLQESIGNNMFLDGLAHLPLNKKGGSQKTFNSPSQQTFVLNGVVAMGICMDNSKGIDVMNQIDSATVCEQMGLKLSEQTTKTGSQ